ncbi:MAG: transposase [Deltaproteobacteria bacterium]
MARPIRIVYEGAVYHITIRGNERRPIFKNDEDRSYFIAKLAESVQRYDVRLYLFTLMRNHTHLVLETPRGNLSRFMQRLQTAYTMYFNHRYHRRGHLMQGRFGATIVDEDEYILKLSRYVHLNPVYIKKVQALPIRERIELLRHYPWSSYRSYIGRCPPLSFVDYAPILEMMGRPKKKQASMYRRFVETGISDMDAAFIDAKKQSRLCIGSDSSNDRIGSLYQELVDARSNHEDISFSRMSHTCAVEDVLSCVSDVLGVSIDQLCHRQRSCLHRALTAYALCEYSGLSQRQVAKILNVSSGSAVSKQLKKLSDQLCSDKQLSRLLETISMRIKAKSP